MRDPIAGTDKNSITALQGGIDIHAHILPAVDDGAGDWRETVRLLRNAYGQGFRHIIATPHFAKEQNTDRLRELAKQLAGLAKYIADDYQISLGQEIMYFEDLPKYLREGRALTLAESRYVLTEFWPGDSFSKIYRAIRQLQHASYIPLVAHAERYACLREGGRLELLLQSGARIQINFRSLEGMWGDGSTRWCRKQVLSGNVQFLGTDMHNMSTRPPATAAAAGWIERRMGREKLTELVRENPQYIMKNQLLPYRPK